jgi:hypothetical protein
MSRARDLGSLINSTAAGKNFIINGGMDFFQRGSFSTTTSGYGLDRWYQISSGSGAAVTVTQQTTGVPPGSRYCARITTAAGSGYGNQYQWIESSNVAALRGKTVTVSIKLRRSSAFAGSLSVLLSKSATIDAGYGATFTSFASATATNAQLPTGTTSSSWYTLSFSAVIPDDGTANGLGLSIQQSQVETSAYWEMAQAQIEIGSVATEFSRSGGDIQGELAKCQRYYQVMSGAGSGVVGSKNNGTTTYFIVPLKVNMRTSPSITSSAVGDLALSALNGSTTYPATSFSTNRSSPWSGSFGLTQATSDGTSGGAGILLIDSPNGWIAFSSEL